MAHCYFNDKFLFNATRMTHRPPFDNYPAAAKMRLQIAILENAFDMSICAFKKIVVTGAAGFIGSNLVAELLARGEYEVVAVDVSRDQTPYLGQLQPCEFVGRDDLAAWLERGGADVDAILHIGACSDTTNNDRAFMLRNNLEYTRTLWHFCARRGARFVYASSAATYGDGSKGYDDAGDPRALTPLNLYGESKHLFDLWALEQQMTPPVWAGLKFFNVYGPRETHKGRMASVALHAFNQIKQNGEVKLFASDRAGIADGGQQRDFVYVKDVVAACLYCIEAQPEQYAFARGNHLFNVGTGQARSFADLARAVFAALQLEPNIRYIPMPEDLRGKYQYFTQARMEKLRALGFAAPAHTLEAGVRDYVLNYLN